VFGNKADKAAAAAAAQAEVDRLLALALPDFAAAILPAYGPSGMQIKSGRRAGAFEVSEWLIAPHPTGYRQPLIQPVLEGLQSLEHAGLLLKRNFGTSGGTTYALTRAGEAALADGTVRRQLG
jgi:hypothetical protein